MNYRLLAVFLLLFNSIAGSLFTGVDRSFLVPGPDTSVDQLLDDIAGKAPNYAKNLQSRAPVEGSSSSLGPLPGESAFSYIERLFPDDLAERPPSMAKRDLPDDVVGNFTMNQGFSTTTWTVKYVGLADNFYYNTTLDFGKCNTSFHLNSVVGTYTDSSGRTEDGVKLITIVHDIAHIVDPKNHDDTAASINHTFYSGVSFLDDVERVFATGIICRKKGVSVEQQSDYLKDELRRRLLMDDGPESAEEGRAGGIRPSTSQEEVGTGTVQTTQVQAPPNEPAPPGPSREGYRMYIALNTLAGGVIGGAIATFGDLIWPPHEVLGKDVTNAAATVGFVSLAGAIMARQVALGLYNRPAEATQQRLSQMGTVVASNSRQAAVVTASRSRGTAMRGREAVNQNVIVAWMRGRVREFLRELLKEEIEDAVSELTSPRGSTSPLNVDSPIGGGSFVNSPRPGTSGFNPTGPFATNEGASTSGSHEVVECVPPDTAFTLAQQLGSIRSGAPGHMNLYSIQEIDEEYARQKRDPKGKCRAPNQD